MKSPYTPLTTESETGNDKESLSVFGRFHAPFYMGCALVMGLSSIAMLYVSSSSSSRRSVRAAANKLRQDLQAKQEENNDLRTEVSTLQDKIAYTKRFSHGGLTVSSNVVGPLNGFFMLVRTKHAIGAIKFTAKGKYPQATDAATYEWYFSADPTVTDFNNAEHGEGEVYENYHPVGEPAPDGSQRWEDMGSKLRVQFGTIDLKWSSGGWLYWQKTPEMQFAPTTAESIEDVRLYDPDRMWYGHPSFSSKDFDSPPK
ncbi:MAG: hypothetical protein AB8G99_21145 [Planctomycetaceae bacterium]